MADGQRADPKNNMRWYHDTVRWLLIVITFAAMTMGMLVAPVLRARRQHAAIHVLRKQEWVVTCDPIPSGPAWARKLLGDEMFFDVVAADSPPGACDEDMAHLQYMPKLQSVFVSGDKITDDGVRHLADLRDLTTVCLSGSRLSDAGLPYFERLENLKHLYVTRTQITQSGVRQLQSVLPECSIWRLEEMTNSIGMQFVLIPAGEFMMGSPAGDEDPNSDEWPQHRVSLTKPFYLGVHEVTQWQYTSVMGSSPWKGKSRVKAGKDYPAARVSWEDAVAFCKRLSAKEGRTYRLPTEAEWEYACRADRATKYSFGDDPQALANYAW